MPNPATEDSSTKAQTLFLRLRPLVESGLELWLPPSADPPSRIHEAMRYSTLAPGKRLRPVLALAMGETLGARAEDTLPSACALEMIHAFSLIHDDLPAMDDDDLRRGRPTNHKAFGEAMAILAGDALACLAFEIVARDTPDRSLVPALIAELGRATGTRGMIGGQVLDMEAEGRPPELGLVREIHRRKTAALIRAACTVGAIAARRTRDEIESAGRFGELIGLAFQVQDDLLDETATPEQMGKATKKDIERGKMTYPACAGIEASRKEAGALTDEAISLIRPLDENGDLEALARFVVARQT